MRLNVDLLRQRAKEIQVDNVKVWEVLRNNLDTLDAYLVAVGKVVRERL